jgi:hypothetical protein
MKKMTWLYLLGHLGEEELGELLDARVLIDEAQREVADLALDLDHVVEDQVRQDHDRCLADVVVIVLRMVDILNTSPSLR